MEPFYVGHNILKVTVVDNDNDRDHSFIRLLTKAGFSARPLFTPPGRTVWLMDGQAHPLPFDQT